MPTKYPADGHTMVLLVPADPGIDDVHAPELAELTDPAVIDISCDIMSGGLNLGVGSGVIDGASICSANVSQSTGRTTVSPTLSFWRYLAPDDTAWEVAEKGDQYWLVVRSGYTYETALAEGQEVWLGLFEMGEPQPQFPGGDTNKSFDLNFNLVSGADFDQKAVIGGAS